MVTPSVIEAPSNSRTSPLSATRVTWEMKCRFVVDAPTVVIHGASPGEPIVFAPGPLFPAEVATNTPWSRALRKARASPSVYGSDAGPPIE